MPSRVPLLTFLCALLHFTADVHAQTSVFFEDFDLTEAPELPPLWTTTGSFWQTSTSSASPGSGLNNIAHSGTSTGLLETPDIDFSGFESGILSFLARRTSSYPADSLVIFASVDGGVSFPHEVSLTGNLPSISSSYELIQIDLSSVLNNAPLLRFRFDARGGSTGGANVRLDDVLLTGHLIAQPPQPADSISTLGFLFSSSFAEAGSTDISIPLSLAGTDTLHGLQFVISWTPGQLSNARIERGAALSDSLGWDVDWHVTNDSLTVLIISNTEKGLAPGDYPLLLSLLADAETSSSSGSESVLLRLSDVVASLDAPNGGNVQVNVSIGQHELIISTPQASLSLQADPVNIGLVSVGQDTTTAIQLGNPGGNRNLVVSNISSDNPLFVVGDSTLVISPDSSASVFIQFRPTYENFGYQEALITISHDGDNGPSTTLDFAGTGVGGRGDILPDGVVDVLDLITGIDEILGRGLLDPSRIVSADLFPFSSGDGSIDVRDLTVLVHGIVNRIWPDSLHLPDPIPGGLQKNDLEIDVQTVSEGAQVRLVYEESSGTTVDLYLENDIPLRGIELHAFSLEHGLYKPSINTVDGSSMLQHSQYDSSSKTLRAVSASKGDGLIATGRWYLGALSVDEVERFKIDTALIYVTALNKRGILSVVPAGTPSHIDDKPGSSLIQLFDPFPKPYSLQKHQFLQIPLSGELPEERVLLVYDLLGRKIFEQIMHPGASKIVLSPGSPSFPIGPGIYFVRFENPLFEKATSIVVTR